MKNLSEILLSILLVVIPLGIIYFIVSYFIKEYFGAELYAIIIVGLASFFIVQDILKKLERRKMSKIPVFFIFIFLSLYVMNAQDKNNITLR